MGTGAVGGVVALIVVITLFFVIRKWLNREGSLRHRGGFQEASVGPWESLATYGPDTSSGPATVSSVPSGGLSTPPRLTDVRQTESPVTHDIPAPAYLLENVETIPPPLTPPPVYTPLCEDQ